MTHSTPADLLQDPLSDHSLVCSTRAGDSEAAQELFHRYSIRLRRLIELRMQQEFTSRFDPDDVLQSVFCLLYEGIKSQHFDVPKGGDLWNLISVLALGKLRDQKAHHSASKRSVYRTKESGESQYEHLLDSDCKTATILRLIVEEFLNGQPEGTRKIVLLRMEGYSISEISEQTGRPLRSVERILQKTRDGFLDLIQN